MGTHDDAKDLLLLPRVKIGAGEVVEKQHGVFIEHLNTSAEGRVEKSFGGGGEFEDDFSRIGFDFLDGGVWGRWPRPFDEIVEEKKVSVLSDLNVVDPMLYRRGKKTVVKDLGEVGRKDKNPVVD